jgi:hypothetical protein
MAIGTVQAVANVLRQQLFSLRQQASTQQDVITIFIIRNVGNIWRRKFHKGGMSRLILARHFGAGR